MPQGQSKVQKPSVSHQLYRQKDRCNGAVGGSAKHRNQSNGSRNSRRNPQQRPTTQPNVAPMKKEGTTSPPLKPADRVKAVKTIFHKNASGRQRPCSTAAVITSMPAAVIVRDTTQKCQRDHRRSPTAAPEPGVGQISSHLPLLPLKHPAKHRRHQCAKCRQNRYPDQHPSL